jgi:DNA-binding HxlR family transcriptional regulator
MDAQWYEAYSVIDLISGKWVFWLLRALEERPLRHNELQRAVPGIGSTALGDTLRRMEEAGFVVRHVDGGQMPPAVSYEVTEAARDLFVALREVARWGRLHIPDQSHVPAKGRLLRGARAGRL